jgi:hypothetical protein
MEPNCNKREIYQTITILEFYVNISMLANAEHKINASTFVFAGTFHAII